MAVNSIFVLFAPKFVKLGCDIASELLKVGGAGRVHGICVGAREVRDAAVGELGALAGQLHWLAPMEMDWIKTPVEPRELAVLEERLGPGAFGRIVTADRRIGRGFVRGGLTRPDYAGDHAVKHPAVVPQRYALGLYHFLAAALDAAKPDVVFCYAVAGAPAVMLGELCRVGKIPFCRLTPTRLGSRYIVDDDPAGRQAPIVRRFRRALEGAAPFSPSTMAEARALLADFRRRPTMPEYMQRNHAQLKAATPARQMLRAARAVAGLARRKLEGAEDSNVPVLSRLIFNARSAWRREYASRRHFSKAPPPKSEFIYYPLHVDPEAATMVRAPWHTDQLAVIEALAKCAPAQMSVVVKEHAPMLGLRPRGFYRQIARMPRVTLLGPEHSGLDLVRSSKLTAVITGTAAWEAMRLRKPVLVIGDSPFLSLGQGVVHEPCLGRLHEAIYRALKMPPAGDDMLEMYIAATLSESFEMPSSLLWDTYDQHPLELRKRVVQQIVASLSSRILDHDRFEGPCGCDSKPERPMAPTRGAPPISTVVDNSTT